MKKLFSLYLISVFAFYGCQSAPQVAEPTPAPTATAATTAEPSSEVADPSSITAGNTGFSPLAMTPANTLGFSLHFGHPDQVVSWSVDFLSSAGSSVRTIRGEAPRLPPTLSWDGKAESGELAPEGTYTAQLSVDSGSLAGPVTARSEPFVLDVTPPSGTIDVSPQPYEPGDPDILVNPPLVRFQVNLVAGGAAISTWRLGVIHPDGRRFFDFISEDHKDNVVNWNGRALNNASLEGGTTYELVAQVFDRYGNVGLVKGSMVVAPRVEPQPVAEAPKSQRPAPVTVSLDGKVVAETQIFFPPFSSDLSLVDAAKAAHNAQALKTLVQALGASPGTRIQVIGHANQVFWQDQAKGEREQNEVLIPLSLARAEAVRDALIRLGLEPTLFEVSGVGAIGAVAPFGDQVTNWKNRRVEFVVAP